jgi:hypothetical protein
MAQRHSGLGGSAVVVQCRSIQTEKIAESVWYRSTEHLSTSSQFISPSCDACYGSTVMLNECYHVESVSFSRKCEIFSGGVGQLLLLQKGQDLDEALVLDVGEAEGGRGEEVLG